MFVALNKLLFVKKQNIFYKQNNCMVTLFHSILHCICVLEIKSHTLLCYWMYIRLNWKKKCEGFNL